MVEKDIAPGLIDKVNKEFDENLAKDKKATALKDKLERGSASYKDAYAYAESVGNARAKAFGDQISSDVLPEGKMHYNIASRLLEDSLTTDHDMVAEYAAGVQKAYNEKAGIGLKALEPDVNQDRINGFVEGVCNADNYDDVAWKLAEPVVTHARSVVDDTIKKNAEFQYKAGVNATVTRDADSKCCEWCSDLAGDYVYPKVPREVFQRHDNCKCTVDYNGRKLAAFNSGGKAHSFRDPGEQEKIEERKKYNDEKVENIKENRYDKLKNEFKPAENISAAEMFIQQYVDDTQFGALGVSYRGIGLDVANEINRTLSAFYETYNVNKFGGITAPAKNTKLGKQIEGAHAGFIKVRNSFILNRDSMKSVSHLEKLLNDEKQLTVNYLKNPNAYKNLPQRVLEVLNNSKTSGRLTVPDTVEDVINHELGHWLENQVSKAEQYAMIVANMKQYAPQISGYACDSFRDYIAESFCSFRKGESVIDPELRKVFTALEKVKI